MTDILLLNYRKIKNYLRKMCYTIKDENDMRKILLRLFYYEINNIPISIIKEEYKINWNNFPKFFKLVKREELINIYNKEVKSNYYKELKILEEKDLDIYEIKKNNSLEISFNTFRPIYKHNWKELSEKVNNISFDKQKSYYSIYLKLYLKFHYFPNFIEFINYIFNKYQTPLHKDIEIIFENIDNAYKDIKEYIKIHNMNFQEVKDVIIKSTNILTRLSIQNY